MASQTMGEFLTAFIRQALEGLLDEPEVAEISIVASERTMVIAIETSPGDRGRLIGGQGKNINALRTICGSIAAAKGIRCYIESVDGKERKKVGPRSNPL